MTRARSGKTVTRGRKRLKKLTKGFRLSRHNLYRQAVVTLIRDGVSPSGSNVMATGSWTRGSAATNSTR